MTDLQDALDPHMRDIVITRPGHDTLRFGPMHASRADTWLIYLKWSRRSTAMPEGTTWEAQPHNPAEPHTDPATIPTTDGELAEALLKDTTYGEAAFPDLYLQLQCTIGDKEAYELWRRACRYADQMENDPTEEQEEQNSSREHSIYVDTGTTTARVTMDLTNDELATLTTFAAKVNETDDTVTIVIH